MADLAVISGFSPRRLLIADAGLTQGDLLAAAIACQHALPPGRHVVNGCADRYHFAVLFLATLLDARTCLLPASSHPRTLQQTLIDYPDTVVVTDDGSQGISFESLNSALDPAFDPALDWASDRGRNANPVPVVAGDHVAALAFTSGSTGSPRPNRKLWRTLVGTGSWLAQRFLSDLENPGIVATVPGQHMYGLEMTTMMALVGGAVLARGIPFYPRDVSRALATLTGERVLVTTPVHLRAMVESGLQMPRCVRVISATAPLSVALARAAEGVFGCQIEEIYGCTEGGSIATRVTVEDDDWRLLGHMTLAAGEGGIMLSGEHLPGDVLLEDRLQLTADGFRLEGRNADMLNVGGKRASLGDLSLRLQELSGVDDGVIFLPRNRDSAGRPAALVVTGLTRQQLVRKLHGVMDAEFIPRPVLLVPQIPRNATGKVLNEALQVLFESLPGAANREDSGDA